MQKNNDIENVAIRLHEKDVQIIPFTKDKKFTVIPNWLPYQTEKQVEDFVYKWFSNDKYNIAIVTGKLSGVTVLDFDPFGKTKEQVDKLKLVSKMIDSGYVVSTPSGGWHIYFKYSPEIKTSTGYVKINKQSVGLDIRNDGGLVGHYGYAEYEKDGKNIAGNYTPKVSVDLNELPAITKEELDMVLSKVYPDADKTSERHEITVPKEGSRNNDLYHTACSQLGLNRTIEEVSTIVYALNNYSKNPLPLDEVQKIIVSASQYEKTSDYKNMKLIDGLVVRKEVRVYIVEVPVKEGKILFSFSEISRAKQSFETVIKIQLNHVSEGLMPPYEQRIDLNSASAVANLATSLNGGIGNKKEGYNWIMLLNRVGSIIKKTINEQRKPEKYNPESVAFQNSSYLLYPFLELGVSNMVHGDSGTGKSYFCLLMAVKATLGENFYGYETKPFKTLYLDWEDTRQNFDNRLHRIANGLSEFYDVKYETLRKQIDYYKPEGSLAEEEEIISSFVEQEKYDLIVIDAGGDASGASPLDEQTVLRMFAAIDRIPCTKLMIHHEPKNTLGVASDKAYYGTTYWKARNRIVWRLTTETIDDTGIKTIKAEMTKANNTGIQAPIYFKMQWSDTPTYSFKSEVTTNHVAGIVEGIIDRKTKIMELLSECEGLSLKDIVSTLEEPRTSVQRTVEEMVKKKLIYEKSTGNKGKGNAYIYAIKTHEKLD